MQNAKWPPGLDFRFLRHLFYLAILRRFFWPTLAYMYTKVAWNLINSISFTWWSLP